jgi:iron complex outermembrane receptor protein
VVDQSHRCANRVGRRLGLAISVSLLALAAAASATAQSRGAGEKDGAKDLEEVVVTGTLLAGVAPVGTNVVGLSREDVVATGANSSNDLLASIPQVGNFGTVPVGTAQIGLPIVRPNIRNLGASGGSTTLVLLNGNRLVGAGILQTTPDPSIIPPGVIERIEVIPDGGSSIYGSDAIGGVVNFITRKSFDGVEATGRYGFADNLQVVDGNLTLGRQWEGGKALISYAYAWHDNLQGIDRDYVTQNSSGRGGSDFRGTSCAPGNITIGATTYALPGRVAGTLNRCDTSDFADIYPREERNSVFASVEQQLSETIDVSATSYWSRRVTTTLSAQTSLSGAITAANPYFRPIGAELAQNVAFSLDDALGHSLTGKATFESYGVTPEVTVRLGDRWRARATANLGHSRNVVHEYTIDTVAASAALAGTNTGTALNPYTPATSSPVVLANIANFDNFGSANQDMDQLRLVADGTLATLPGGDVKLAVGVEYFREKINSVISLDKIGSRAAASRSSASRHVAAVFGEVLVPLVSEAASRPGLRGFDLSGSIRHDDYNDVGSTTNPKVGFNYRPFNDLTIRGNFGTSFHAPSLADTTSTSDSRAVILQVSPFRPATSPITDLFRPTVVLAGGNPGLKPEQADTWSLGFDWEPAQIEGLRLSATFWNVKFKDAIGLAPFSLPTLFSDPNYAGFFVINPSLAQLKTLVGTLALNGAPSLESLYVGRSPFIVIDARRNNLGAVHTTGIDFAASYAHPTDFGVLSADITGAYTLKRKTQAIRGGSYTDALDNGTGKLAFVASAGLTSGPVSARASLNYRGGYPVIGLANQTHVDAFKTVDLFLGYDLKSVLAADDVLLTLNVDNLFNEDPPFINTSAGYANGSTLGRLVSVGVRTRF